MCTHTLRQGDVHRFSWRHVQVALALRREMGTKMGDLSREGTFVFTRQGSEWGYGPSLLICTLLTGLRLDLLSQTRVLGGLLLTLPPRPLPGTVQCSHVTEMILPHPRRPKPALNQPAQPGSSCPRPSPPVHCLPSLFPVRFDHPRFASCTHPSSHLSTIETLNPGTNKRTTATTMTSRTAH